uniref:Uncharacterized protein n=1 Tax=Anguilla anguilla TaxID=7936 RepID=A0A0E9SGF2_ANGAN
MRVFGVKFCLYDYRYRLCS